MQIRFSIKKRALVIGALLSIISIPWCYRREIFWGIQRWLIAILAGAIVVVPIGITFVLGMTAGIYCTFWRVLSFSLGGFGLLRALVQFLLGIGVMGIFVKVIMLYIEEVGDRVLPIFPWIFRIEGAQEIEIKREFLRKYLEKIRVEEYENEPIVFRIIVIVVALFAFGMYLGAKIIS